MRASRRQHADGVPEQGHGRFRREGRSQAGAYGALLQRQGQVRSVTDEFLSYRDALEVAQPGIN